MGLKKVIAGEGYVPVPGGLATPVSILNGGTGATTAPGALAALGGLAIGGVGTTLSAFQISVETVTNSATLVDSTQCVLALAVGTWDCESWELTTNPSTVGSSKSACAFSGTASQSGQTNLQYQFAFGQSLQIVDTNTTPVAYNQALSNFGTNTAMIINRKFRLVVTVAGNLTIQFAESVATPVTSVTFGSNAYLKATRVA